MSRPLFYDLRLYVAGNAANSSLAVANLKALCRDYLPNCHTVEVIDVFREPQRALADGIFMTPTLMKLAPGPILKVVGNLSERPTVLQALGLDPLAA